MQDWWNSLTSAARRSLLGGAAAVLLLIAGLGWWLLRPQQAVLFSSLSTQDAAVLAQELDRQKLAYRVADDGGTLLVDAAQVHATRLRLMGRDLPLQGAVGFELFNGSEIGMSEFAQKVHWQRALQGELTRTILAFPEVRQARVHLALPEQGLFRQSVQPPKAAVTIGLRPGRSLRPEQVQGIQRLLAAAVPALAVHDVTVLDEQGIALSRPARLDGEGAAAGLLELKRETEAYLARKAMQVLDRSIGPGLSLASVDVVLAADQVRTTTEDVLPAQGLGRAAAAGVLVRERESLREGIPDRGTEVRTDLRGPASSQRDAEYQPGRRVEQVVSQPGAIRRLQLVAVVQRPLPVDHADELRLLLAAAVGALPERGDQVRVQVAPAAPAVPVPGSAADTPGLVGDRGAMPSATHRAPAGDPQRWWLVALDGVAIAAALAAAWLLLRSRHARRGRLSPPQRQLALGQVQAWLADVQPLGEPASAGTARRAPAQPRAAGAPQEWQP